MLTRGGGARPNWVVRWYSVFGLTAAFCSKVLLSKRQRR